MPTVDKSACWLDGNHFNVNFSIDKTGTYYCNLPEPLANKLGRKKETAPALNMLKAQVRALINAYQDSQPEVFCPDRRHIRPATSK